MRHGYIMSVYLRTCLEKTPGLLSRGGAIGGGLPVTRPDLHFAYNLVETVPIVGAFVYQLRFAYNEWLRKAFPRLQEPLLIETTNMLEHYTYAPGEAIVRQAGASDRFYIVTSGEVAVSRAADGVEKTVAVLGPGQYFGEMGLLAHTSRTATVTAMTEVELLSLDRQELQ